MVQHYCDKCGRLIFPNKVDGRFSTVVTLRNCDRKEDYKVYELCDYCFSEFVERSLRQISDGDFYSNMKEPVPINIINKGSG